MERGGRAEVAYDITVDVAYVGTAKNGGFADYNANASDVPGGGADSQPFFDTLGRNGDVLLWGPITKSRYNSLQVAINRPFTNGLLLKGAYTLSRAKDETDNDGWDQVAYSAPSLLSRNYALAGYDRPNVFQMAFVYELPYKTRGGSGNEACARCSATGRSMASTRLPPASLSRSPRAARI